MSTSTASVDSAQKALALAALGFAIELVFFKFVPDLGTAVIQHGQSDLASYAQFEKTYLVSGSVHHARFLGNFTLYQVARWIGQLHESADIRLHPLRIAAGVLTPIYAYLGAHLAIRRPLILSWRYFLSLYAFMVVIGQYVFYPADMPALAFLSMALWCVIQQRMGPAFVLMLITGLYRESSLHVVWFVATWVLSMGPRGSSGRLGWLAVFAVGFAVEYVLVRHFFPGPVSSVGGLILDPRELLLGGGTLSLTCLCSVGLAALFPLACLLALRDVPAEDWRRTFFRLNAWAFPLWLLFYRTLNGNLSEFRMLFPVLIASIYGIAYAAAQSGTNRFSEGALDRANRVS